MTIANARVTAVRRSKRDSEAVLVAGLTLAATVIALWDFILLAFAAS
jgi:hypothetical protein